MLSSAVYVIKSQVLGLQRPFFYKKNQGSVVPRSIMTSMNYFEYQYGQTSNMPKFNHEKHETCLVPKMHCVSYNELLSLCPVGCLSLEKLNRDSQQGRDLATSGRNKTKFN